MTEVGNIVTLEDNKEYLILEELEKDGTKYLYSVRVLIDETPTDEYLIFSYQKDENGEYLVEVQDKVLYDQLVEDFKDIVSNKLLSE
jgi:hypothetical protein